MKGGFLTGVLPEYGKQMGYFALWGTKESRNFLLDHKD